MNARIFMLLVLVCSFALPAAATVKVYDSSADNGTPGDVFQYTTTQCPPISASLGIARGEHTLTDTGGGTVTMNSYRTNAITLADFGTAALTGVFGPGAFVFVNGNTANEVTTTPLVGTGSTAPSTGSVSWGVISGWSSTGTIFCISSPQTICTESTMVAHGVTDLAGPTASPTYDIGTWTFDAEGDLTATSYISQTTMGGLSNRQTLIRGAYVGSSLPALPLVGAGAVALGLLVAGSRSVLRKK